MREVILRQPERRETHFDHLQKNMDLGLQLKDNTRPNPSPEMSYTCFFSSHIFPTCYIVKYVYPQQSPPCRPLASALHSPFPPCLVA